MVRRHTQLVYADADRAFTERSKSHLTKAPNPRKWWSTVKMAVFGVCSNLLPLTDREGTLGWSANEKASLFSARFEAKQRRDSFQQLHSCDPSLVLCSVAFRSSFIRGLLLDLDPYGIEMMLMVCFPFFTSRWLGC